MPAGCEFKPGVKYFCLFLFFLMAINEHIYSQERSEYFSHQGKKIYYEVHGKGEPLLLLHGYTQSLKSWLPFLKEFSENFQVFLIDLPGHGMSDSFTEELSIPSIANALHAFLENQKLKNVKAIGFSFGGDILFQLAVRYPQDLASMIIIGACGSWNANDFPKWMDLLSYKNIDNLPWMREQHRDEMQIKAIFDQLKNYKIYVSEEELKKIEIPVMLVYGDQEDSVTWECIMKAKENMSDTRLWVLPDSPHRAHTGKNQEQFLKESITFLINVK
ncbi:MAG: alpha/beta hydrolase [Bacteroidetes bacterium]|nr:MAG: alpha/beta hydrolase [Bacteroidota bacterium]REK05689.1 MAG: alpha/beta hydrolase [Bacteroidota bacterium]REK50069.1 MAG: alpha/beta hydrolase [Bacteroidota bacterium]